MCLFLTITTMAQVLTPSGRLPALKSPLQVSQTPDHQEEISDWSVLQGATDMVRAGIMDMVWEREKGGKSYKIGFLKQSPKLQQALNGGQLNQILQNLSDSYREVYGRAPWEEYLCCSNSECDGKMSLQDVFGDLDQGLSLREQEEGRFRTPSQYSCPKDGEDMD